MRKLFYISFLFGFAFFFVEPLYSAMIGGDFEIHTDSVGFLGSQVSSAGDFVLFDTGGEFFATTTEGGNIILKGGFQAIEKGSLFFSASTSTVNLGTLSLSSLSTSSIDLTVTTDSTSGYSVTMVEDGNLCAPSVAVCTNDIDDVSDGTVTAGSEEYGILTSGIHGQQNALDTAIDGTVTLASFGGVTSAIDTSVIFKAAIGNSSLAGSYTHDVTFTLTVNP